MLGGKMARKHCLGKDLRFHKLNKFRVISGGKIDLNSPQNKGLRLQCDTGRKFA